METDLTNPYGDDGSGGTGKSDGLPEDGSWWGLFEGVWRRMTNPLPGTTSS